MQTILFSHKYRAIPNIGGIITDSPAELNNPRALRVSERLASACDKSPRPQWVVVDLPDGQAAVTVVEAREMELVEAVWK